MLCLITHRTEAEIYTLFNTQDLAQSPAYKYTLNNYLDGEVNYSQGFKM